ncbi:MAG: hypothetical protein WAQ53_03525 [Thiofilum sp.]|uniref:hypothetical protein n=1 Tax=Thiofilum sp. TaxID=2212733 RepID=UPI0025CD9C2F|nr:hypothetical protein [Thiofilum sp.]MBK8454760.1 hypothetical protein [Thiofilum sp.]
MISDEHQNLSYYIPSFLQEDRILMEFLSLLDKKNHELLEAIDQLSRLDLAANQNYISYLKSWNNSIDRSAIAITTKKDEDFSLVINLPQSLEDEKEKVSHLLKEIVPAFTQFSIEFK